MIDLFIYLIISLYILIKIVLDMCQIRYIQNATVSNEELELLQRSIVLSHSAGFGEYMEDATVRLMMVLKINSLSRGFSGIRLTVIQALIALLNAQVYPCVPKKGSVGASGDLAPLSHMVLPLLGEGEMSYNDEIISAINEKTAVVTLTHVNYKTGQIHDMKRITEKAHENGALIIWDLAHSLGALPVDLNM